MGGKNRIVVDYGDRRELVLLTAIITEDGVELSHDIIKKLYSQYFTVVKKFELKTFNELRETIMKGEDNKEGFVIKFANGERIKMKYAEYCRLHSIVTNVSNLVVWEHLMNHRNFDELLDRVPNEFFSWLNKTIKDLQEDFNEIERQSLKEFYRIYYVNNITNRKSFAMEVINSKYQSILFRMYNKQSYDEIIWKLIRPKFSKPFQDGYENTIADN